MKCIVYKKENGKLFEQKVVSIPSYEESTSYFFTDADRSFIKSLHLNLDCLNDLQTATLMKNISTDDNSYQSLVFLEELNCRLEKIMYYFVHSPFSNNMLGFFYEKIKVAKNKTNLCMVVNELSRNYRHLVMLAIEEEKVPNIVLQHNGTGIFKFLNTNSSVTLAVITKKIINTYYEKKLMDMPLSELEQLKRMQDEGESVPKMLEKIGEHFPKMAFSNGVFDLSQPIFMNQFAKVYLKRITDKYRDDLGSQRTELSCFQCQNHQCPTFLEWNRVPIVAQNWLTDGIQIIGNPTTNYDMLMIFGCKNYQMQTIQDGNVLREKQSRKK